MFKVYTAAYCGMRLPHGDYDTLREARDRVAKRLSYLHYKMDCPIARLEPNVWEICEPENCMMVPDFCGILRIAEIPTEESDYDEADAE